jgi:hypothetical protein
MMKYADIIYFFWDKTGCKFKIEILFLKERFFFLWEGINLFNTKKHLACRSQFQILNM